MPMVGVLGEPESLLLPCKEETQSAYVKLSRKTKGGHLRATTQSTSDSNFY